VIQTNKYFNSNRQWHKEICLLLFELYVLYDYFYGKKMWKVLIDSKNNKTILLHTFYHSNIVGHWDRSKGLGIVFIDDW